MGPWPEQFEIFDISQPVSETTAVFPGDVPFSRQVTVNYRDSGVLNLCAFSMSPHVGTHADAPVHVRDDLHVSDETAGNLPLTPYVGSCLVVDIAPCAQGVTWAQVAPQLADLQELPGRILFRTAKSIRYDIFEGGYAWFAPDLIEEMAARGVTLLGIDTPSVDPIQSKTLESHHVLLKHGMVWLENLDLTRLPVKPGEPMSAFLVALPLKFTQLEASPVRAVLFR